MTSCVVVYVHEQVAKWIVNVRFAQLKRIGNRSRKKMKKSIVLDCLSLLKHSYHMVPDIEEENAVRGVMHLVNKLCLQAKELVGVFVTANHEENPDYLKDSYQQLKSSLEARKILCVELEDKKTIAGFKNICDSNLGKEIVIVSLDDRLLPLVSTEVTLWKPCSNREVEDYTVWDVTKLKENYGVQWDRIKELIALTFRAEGKERMIARLGELRAKQLLGQFDWQQILSWLSDEQIASEEELEKVKGLYDVYCKKSDWDIEIPWELAVCDNILPAKDLVEEPTIDKNDAAQTEQIQAVDWKRDKYIKITNWKQAEDVLGKLKSNEEFFSIVLCVDQGYTKNYFEKKQLSEQMGQLTLFSEPVLAKESFLEGIAIGSEDFCYYFDPSSEWFQMRTFAEELCELHKEHKKFVVHNLKEYLYIFKQLCLSVGASSCFEVEGFKENVLDASLAQYLIDPLQEKYEFDYLALSYLKLAMDTEKEFLGKKCWSEKKKEDAKFFWERLCDYASILLQVEKPIQRRLIETKQEKLYREIELPLVQVLFEMEQRGILVNKEKLAAYGEKLQTRIGELEAVIYEQAGEVFNINSPKQLGVLLFEKLQLPGGKKTKSGYSTAADILERLKDEYQIVADVLEYRQLSKLKSTYADGLANYISQSDGRIHGRFNQTVTATGRLSSTEPNLQNIPIRMEIGRQIREVFIPKEGWVFLDADYSQIELRLLAHMSGDRGLIDAYSSGKDIHRITASEVFHTPFEQVTKEVRSKAKAVNFGIVYGISSFGLGQDLNISRKEAEEYIERYFETYPGVKTYLDRSVEEGKANGQAVSMFGRVRPIPELSASNFMQRQFGERIAMNSPIQGTAADIIKIAMIRVEERMRREGLASRLLLQIHDELLVETKPEEIDMVSKILKEEMEGAAELAVSLEVEVEQGNNWNEAH